MDKIRRNFLWAGNEELTAGKCKIAWVNVAKPIKHGGLGIRNTGRFGRALRLRWLWYEWQEPQRPWHSTDLPVDDTDRALFSAATRVTVNNGQKASFWNSSWIENTSPARRKNRTVAAALHEDKWIRDIAYNLTNNILHEYFGLWTLIDELELDVQNSTEDDAITWTLTTTGEYTAKSAYEIQFLGHQNSYLPYNNMVNLGSSTSQGIHLAHDTTTNLDSGQDAAQRTA